jgi:hypothetical protein
MCALLCVVVYNFIYFQPPPPAVVNEVQRKTDANTTRTVNTQHRRCCALYDCTPDNTDELAFTRGQFIRVTNECVDGEDHNWMVCNVTLSYVYALYVYRKDILKRIRPLLGCFRSRLLRLKNDSVL